MYLNNRHPHEVSTNHAASSASNHLTSVPYTSTRSAKYFEMQLFIGVIENTSFIMIIMNTWSKPFSSAGNIPDEGCWVHHPSHYADSGLKFHLKLTAVPRSIVILVCISDLFSLMLLMNLNDAFHSSRWYPPNPQGGPAPANIPQIGRASCRERV